MIDKSDIQHMYLVLSRKALYLYELIKDNQGLFSIALFLIINLEYLYQHSFYSI